MSHRTDATHTCMECEACEELKTWKRKLSKMLNEWNWNASPRRVARDIQELVKEGFFESEDEAIQEMKEYGYRQNDIDKVLWELEGEV